jgi:metacaspase-1
MSRRFTQGNALVIGIANYPNLCVLPQAVLNDARDIAGLLSSSDYCGYIPSNVELLLDQDATLDRIRQGFHRLGQATANDDTAVIFFSGHGGRKVTGSDAGSFLIPYDGEPNQLRQTALESEELTTLLRQIKAQRVVVFLDACHSGGTGELKTLSPEFEFKAGLGKSDYDKLANGVGRVIIASSRPEEYSLVMNNMPNSIFSHYLLDALRGAAGVPNEDMVCVFDVFKYVSENVPQQAVNQHPIFKAHELENNFPLALRFGGKKAALSERTPAASPTPISRTALSGPAKAEISKRLVDCWEELATYLGISPAEKAKFDRGREGLKILDWLEQRNRLHHLRDALNYLGRDDLITELDRHPS